MANEKHTSDNYKYATVDSTPSTLFATDEVEFIRIPNQTPYYLAQTYPQKVWFSSDGGGSMTVTLQFQRPIDLTWIDYMTFTTVQRLELSENTSGVKWRAVVKEADYISGSCKFGFDW